MACEVTPAGNVPVADTFAEGDYVLASIGGLTRLVAFDQFGALSATQIKTLYESNADTNALTDALLAQIGTGGSSDTLWTFISGATTATVGQKLASDVTAGAYTITLPSAPADGDPVTIAVIRGDATANVLTIDGNGSNISGAGIVADATLGLDLPQSAVDLTYNEAAGEWYIAKLIAQPVGAGDPVLGDLGNVNVALATNGQVLSFDGTNWINTTFAGGGDMLASVYDPTAIAASPFARANHTGTQSISTVTSLQATLDGKVASDPSGVTGADAITNMMSLTQAEYDAIVTPNASTFYVITP